MAKALGYNPGFENFVESVRKRADEHFWTRKPRFACELCDKEYEVIGKCQACDSIIVHKKILLQITMTSLEDGWQKHKKRGWTADRNFRDFLREIKIKKDAAGAWRVVQ